MSSIEERAACQEIMRAMGEHVRRFITPVSEIVQHDRGRAWGSGTYVQINGSVYLLTNEHVARMMPAGGIAHLPHPGDLYHRVTQPIAVLDFPMDLGVVRIDPDSWEMATQSSLPIDKFDDVCGPVEDELLFVCGYPGFTRRAIAPGEIRYPRDTQFGWLTVPAVPVLTSQARSLGEYPDCFDPQMHIVVNYEALAFRPGEGIRETPDPSGFSGSLLWDTKFIASGGENWDASQAKVCGLIHRWNDDLSLLMATKVEWVREALLSAVRREAAFFEWIRRGEPLWEDLVDWHWAEQTISRLMP